MKTSLGDTTTIARFYIWTDEGDLGDARPTGFEVLVNLRGLAPLLRKAIRSVGGRATALGGAIVVDCGAFDPDPDA